MVILAIILFKISVHICVEIHTFPWLNKKIYNSQFKIILEEGGVGPQSRDAFNSSNLTETVTFEQKSLIKLCLKTFGRMKPEIFTCLNDGKRKVWKWKGIAHISI